MKKIILLCLLSITFSAQSQLVSGDLVQEGRKLVSQCDFRLSGGAEGDIYYELAVDREGNVTSERLITERTTVVSTPTRMRAKQMASELKFEPGTHYPHYHHVVIKIAVRKSGQ